MENVWYVKIGKRYFRIEKMGKENRTTCSTCPIDNKYNCKAILDIATQSDASCHRDNYQVDHIKHLKGESIEDAEDYIGRKPIKIKKSEVKA